MTRLNEANEALSRARSDAKLDALLRLLDRRLAVQRAGRQTAGKALADDRGAEGGFRGRRAERHDLVAGRQDRLGLRDDNVALAQDRDDRRVRRQAKLVQRAADVGPGA